MELLACLVLGVLLGAGLYRFFSIQGRGRDHGHLTVVDDALELALWASGEELWDLDVATGRQIRRGHIPDLDRSQPGSEASMEAFLARVHPDDRVAVAEAVQRVAADAQAHAEVSYRVRHQSGSWAWLHSRGRAVAHAADGTATRIVGTTRDITALKQHEERLDFALRAAGEELWEVDRSADEIRRENPLDAIEYRAGDFRLTREEFGELLHPDDVDRLTQDFMSVMSGEHLDFSAVYR
ncbi:MAG: PAS domain-containing protein, partial [Arenimonas sp.]